MKFSELVNLTSPGLLEGKKIKLMRHVFKDDQTLLKHNKTFSDDDIESKNLIVYPASSEEKMASIRVDVRLAEIACAEQGKDALKNVNIVFAFAASKGKTAEFIGAFDVGGPSTLAVFLKKYEKHLSNTPSEVQNEWGFKRFVTKLGYSKQPIENNYYYKLSPLEALINEYRNRVVIDWGESAVSWHQNSLDKEISQIRAKGFVRDFSDYYDFVLAFDELKSIIREPDGNPEWISKLSAVSGVYLILDIKTVDQYIGSAYGAEGFLGRWKVYCKNNHGDNKSLKNLIDEEGTITLLILKYLYYVLWISLLERVM